VLTQDTLSASWKSSFAGATAMLNQEHMGSVYLVSVHVGIKRAMRPLGRCFGRQQPKP
jgi:hypothetical protein